MELPNKFATCPTCGHQLDGATCLTDEDQLPKPGDLSLCIKCGTILEYEEGYFVHELPKETLESFKITDEDTYFQLIFLQETIQKKP